jgi:hypothetical protein
MRFCFCFFYFLLHLNAYCAGTEGTSITLEIKPVVANKPLALSTTNYILSTGDTVTIDRFRFYLTSFVFTLENGEKFVEQNSYHLIDAEDPSTLSITFRDLPAGKISGVSFNVGVDSTASVSGALSGDLDPVKGMYWAWNSGYINAKLEGICKTNKGTKNHPFEFHIGGYLPPYYAIRSVELQLKDEDYRNGIVLEAEIEEWLKGLDLKKENSIVIPGPEATTIADKYSRMFRIIQR